METKFVKGELIKLEDRVKLKEGTKVWVDNLLGSYSDDIHIFKNTTIFGWVFEDEEGRSYRMNADFIRTYHVKDINKEETCTKIEKLSDFKSGMVIEINLEGDIERYLTCEINGNLEAFNDKYSLGELEYYLDENLKSRVEDFDLLSIYTIQESDFTVWKSIKDNLLDKVWERQSKKTDVSELINTINVADELGILEANLEQLLDNREIVTTGDIVGDLNYYLLTDISYTLENN